MSSPSDEYGRSKLVAERFALNSIATKVFEVWFPVVLGLGAHRAWLPQIREKMLLNKQIEYANELGYYSTLTTLEALFNLINRLTVRPAVTMASFQIGGILDINIRQVLGLMRFQLSSKSFLSALTHASDPPAVCASQEAIKYGYEPLNLSDSIHFFLDTKQ